MSEILLGTCGWSYADWEDSLYSQKQGKLKQYVSIFPTVEIDSTFYALPKGGTVLGWARHTPPDFVFSAKLPQTITHKKALDLTQGIEADLDQFLEVMRPLTEAEKLECVLAQLPPYIKFDLGRLESFLALLPKRPNSAVEFRHNSWLQEGTMRLLEKYKVAYTIVDEPLLPPDVYITSDIAYLRWHGRGDKPWFNYKYSEKELREWVPKIRDGSEKAKKVLGYFNNHFKGYAPENCLMMMQMLGTTTPLRDLTLLRLARQRMEGKAAVRTGTLEAWTGPIGRTTSEKYLAGLASPETLAKARLIPEQNISLREDSRKRLAAYVEETTVDLDLEKRTIIHSCPAWRKSAPEKKFCPHVAGLFLCISHERASAILSSINSNLNAWKFESRRIVGPPR